MRRRNLSHIKKRTYKKFSLMLIGRTSNVCAHNTLAFSNLAMFIIIKWPYSRKFGPFALESLPIQRISVRFDGTGEAGGKVECAALGGAQRLLAKAESPECCPAEVSL